MERSDRCGRREPIPKKILHCCCGRPECLILKRNFSVLESVEKDVHTAAQLGQALLSRHEAYMAEAERERVQLNARIDRLEIDKDELETQNSLKVQDNLALIDQLEMLNNTVSDADAKIRALEATLLSSQQALRHLEGTACRTADAERHLKELAEEQERLHEELQTSREEARSHAYRFKEAQRGILDMQDQLDRMEREARQERERHAEIVEKMERQREVEKQLDAAALRLKGAAASKSIKHQRHGSNKIVGNFVRDLLQDNANLQLAITELREMLLNSNDEIQSLREQLLFHQPVTQNEGVSLASSLRAELEPLMDSPKISQQMHVHHHYHIAKQDGRRPKRKRQGLLGAYLATSPLRPSSTPASSERWRSVSSPAGSSSRSCRSATPTAPEQIASGPWDEYSVPSSAISSIAGSPQSISRGYFDHVGTDMDPPISPLTNYDPLSPSWRASHKKKISEASTTSFQSLSVIDGEYTVAQAHQSNHRWASTTIREEDEGGEEEEDEEDPYSRAFLSLNRTASTANRYLADELHHCQNGSDDGDDGVRSLKVRRFFTQEISMSLAGGLDMNTLTSPGQITLRSLGGADAVVTGVNAEPTLSRASSRTSNAALRNHFAHFQVSRMSSTLTPEAITSQTPRGGPGLGGWAGWRPWGGNSKVVAKPVTSEADDPKRASGINQPGAVPGFSKYWMSQKRKGAPAQITTETIDRDALSDGLCGNTVTE